MDQWSWGCNNVKNIGFESEHRKISSMRYSIQDSTLVMVENFFEYDDDEFSGDVHLDDRLYSWAELTKNHFVRVHLWNLNTLQYVTELNFHDIKKFVGFCSEEYAEAHVFHVHARLASNKLSLILKIEEEENLFRCQTQLWKLDTADPSSENISYLTTFDHEYEFTDDVGRQDVTPTGKIDGINMNSKLLCFDFQCLIERKLTFFVYLIDDHNLTHHSTLTAIEGIPYGEEFANYAHIFESEISTKIAFFDGRSNELKVYKFDSVACLCFQINLNQVEVNKEIGISQTQMVFLVGKLVIIVNEDGVVIDGKKLDGKKLDFLSYFEDFFGVSADGIVTYKYNKNFVESTVHHYLHL